VPKVRLTELGLLNFKPSDRHVDYWDVSLPTFGVRVSPKGTKTFVLKMYNGRQALGRFHPEIFPLSKARTEAKRRLAEYTLGKIRPQSITYAKAAELFVEDKRKSCRESTADQYEWFLGRLKFPGQLSDITEQEFERQIKRVKSPSTYNHVLAIAKIFFNWCIKRHYIDKTPVAGLSPNSAPGRSRVLADEELKRIWEACERMGDDLPPSYTTIVRLLILCGQRRGEIAALRTSFLNGDTATLPAHLAKNSREHTFPLPRLAIDILQSVEVDSKRNDALFFPARGKPDKPFSGWSKGMKALRTVLGKDFKHFTLHDLRRTYRTIHAKIGTPPHIAERLVNHINARSDMQEIYDRWTYMPEMKAATERFESHIKGVISGLKHRARFNANAQL